MSGKRGEGNTETVTKTTPRPPSNLHDGMPIADDRVGFGKGAGKWVLIFCGIVVVGVLLLTGV